MKKFLSILMAALVLGAFVGACTPAEDKGAEGDAPAEKTDAE